MFKHNLKVMGNACVFAGHSVIREVSLSVSLENSSSLREGLKCSQTCTVTRNSASVFSHCTTMGGKLPELRHLYNVLLPEEVARFYSSVASFNSLYI